MKSTYTKPTVYTQLYNKYCCTPYLTLPPVQYT